MAGRRATLVNAAPPALLASRPQVWAGQGKIIAPPCDLLAQLASPDMRVPISYALAWPDRAAVSAARLDLAKLGSLNFEAPDSARFPALDLCRSALQRNAAATAALSAANEVAVNAFLESRIGFLDICTIVAEVMAVLEGSDAGLIAKSPSSFAEVTAVDQAARAAAQRIAANLAAA